MARAAGVRLRFGALVVASMFMFIGALAAAPQTGVNLGAATCGVALANGIYQSFMDTGADRVSIRQSLFQNKMCSKDTRVKTLASKESWGVVIDGSVQYQLGGTKEAAQKLLDAYRSNLCSFDAPIPKAALDMLAALVQPNTMLDYRQCRDMWERGVGLEPSISADGNSITITISYSLADGGSATFTRVTYSGPASCKYLSNALRPGATLNAAAGKMAVQCDRNSSSLPAGGGEGPITVVVTTSAGSRSFDLPEHVASSGGGSPQDPPLSDWAEDLESRLREAVGGLQKQVDGLRKDLDQLTAGRGGTLSKMQAAIDRLARKLDSLGVK